jgi:hypothetical protein
MGFLVEVGIVLYGRWFHLALCGVIGGREMIGALKTVNRWYRNLRIFFFKTINGQLPWT